MKPKTPPPEMQGHFGLRVPGLSVFVWTAADRTHMEPGIVHAHNRRAATLLYTYKPAAIKLLEPKRRWTPLPAESAVLIPAFLRYDIDPGKGRDLRQTWFSMMWVEDSPIGAFFQNPQGLARILDPDRVLAEGFETLASVIREHPVTADAFWPLQQAGEQIVRLASRATRIEEALYRLDRSALTRRADPLVPRIIGFMKQHIAERLTVAAIAKHLSASVSTVAHRHRAATGETPMETLRRLRMHEAKGLLSQGVFLSDIASRLGFYDAHHFSREFKREVGVSPSGFIKKTPTPSPADTPFTKD